jgi:hypothetical protein
MIEFKDAKSDTKRVSIIHTVVHNVEIRKVEAYKGTFTTEKGETREYSYILLHCDDENGERIYFKDKDMSRADKYARGQVGDVLLRIDSETGFGGKTTVTFVDFTGLPADEPEPTQTKKKK